VAVAAGLASIEQLDAQAYERLARTTEILAGGLAEAASEAGRPVQVHSARGLLTVFFTERPVSDYAGAAACDLPAYGAWCRALLDRGVYPPASQFEAWFPSLAHADSDVERTIEAARAAFAEIP
jgi:glutamate-1-semialdehyde 2,1-aminomutase